MINGTKKSNWKNRNSQNFSKNFTLRLKSFNLTLQTWQSMNLEHKKVNKSLIYYLSKIKKENVERSTSKQRKRKSG